MSAEAKAPELRMAVDPHDREPGQQPDVTALRLGPLLAVCGLVGGAGTTTLAYLVALAAAKQWNEPVLLADTGGPGGGLSAVTGVELPHSLPEVASQLAVGLPLRGALFTSRPDGLRVLATGPEFNAGPAHPQLVSLLLDAREAHALTVVDCGTLARDVDLTSARAATHIARVIPGTRLGADRARRVLDVAPAFDAKEILIARQDHHQAKAPLRELRRVAAARRAPLVLMPHLSGLDADRIDRAAEESQVTVQAILGALRR